MRTAPRSPLFGAAAIVAAAALALGSSMMAGAAGAVAPARYTYAFKDADLADAAEAILGRALNLTYSIDPDLTGKITFRIDRNMTPAELLAAFESTLALQDIAVVKNGQTLVLEKRAKAKASATLRPLEEGKHAIGYQTLAVPLTNAAPQEVAKALQSMGSGAVVSYVDEARSQIVLTGTAQEVDAAVQTIRLFDRNGAPNARMRFLPLQQAPAAEVAEEVTDLLRGAHVEGTSVVAMKRMNGLYAFARSEAGLDEVSRWVARLDIAAADDRSNTLWIYHPHNASSDGLKAALTEVLGEAPSNRNGGAEVSAARTEDRRMIDPSGLASAAVGLQRTPSRPPESVRGNEDNRAVAVKGSGIRIGVDKDTNTLLISASQSQWLQIEKILVDLDRMPGEILIEASIIEVTLTKDNSLGVNFSVLANKHVNATYSSNSNGAVGSSFPGLSVTYLDANLQAAVNALSSDSKIEVISAPKIITLDNKAATLNVGNQVPVVTQSAQSTLNSNAPLVNTVDYRNTGVILKVTPRITGMDTILLDISQEVSSVEETTSSNIDSPTIQQRQLESTVILNDGGVVALGGMITSTKSTNSSGVPILKDIPAVGALFRSTTRNLDRTELVVLLTAKIIHNRNEADRTKDLVTTDMKALKANAAALHP